MLKINLLGKKRQKNPIQELLIKAGVKNVSGEKVKHWIIKGPGLKLAILMLVYFATSYAIDYYIEDQLKEVQLQIMQASQKTRQIQGQLDAKKGIRAQMTRLIEDENLIKKRIRVIESLSEDRKRVFQVLNEITLIIPKETWIDNIRLQQNELHISGAAWDFNPINQFLRSLGSSVYFSEVVLTNIKVEDPPQIIKSIPKALQKLKQFNIKIRIVGG